MLDTRTPVPAPRFDRDATDRLTRVRSALSRMANDLGDLRREQHALRREVQRLRRENLALRTYVRDDDPDAPTGD